MRWKILTSIIVFTISCNFTFAACPSADLNGDCFVDYEDFALMAAQWLTTDPCVPDDMVYIPDGEFDMGDHFNEGYARELPVHTVYLDSFFMSKFEITNRQYCDYLNSAKDGGDIKVVNGIVYASSDGSNSYPYCDTYSYSSDSQIGYSGGVFNVRTKGERDMSDDPMVRVSWYGATAYCNWRSQQEGYQALYDLSDPNWPCDFSKHGYRLPTEAEWEYAARGGNHNPYYRFPWGDTINHDYANYRANGDAYTYDTSPYTSSTYHPDYNDGIIPYTAPVGSFSANGYGLYDMSGNVWAWCNDRFSGTYYQECFDIGIVDNPTGPVSGASRVLRCGGWSSIADICRVASRYSFPPPHLRGWSNGYRVVLNLE
jgi:formylglycine-generating enzyme required for sulfatase activity